MKLFIMAFLSVLTLTLSAHAIEGACPQLSGDYYCMFDYGGAGNLSVSQMSEDSGIAVYVYNYEDEKYVYNADNIWRDLGDSGSMIDQKQKVSCGENSMIDDFSYHSQDLSSFTTLQFIHKLDKDENIDGSYTQNDRVNGKDQLSSGNFFCLKTN